MLKKIQNPESKYINISQDKTSRSDINLVEKNESDILNMEDERKGEIIKNMNSGNHNENNTNKLNDVIEDQNKEMQNLNKNDKNKNENKIKFEKPEEINKIRPSYLDIKPFIMQNPQMQLFSSMNNLAVCPFCKYTGTVEIEYIRSQHQKTLCIILALICLCFFCWVPFVIRDLSDKNYKCGNCKKVIKTIPHNEV